MLFCLGWGSINFKSRREAGRAVKCFMTERKIAGEDTKKRSS